MRRFLFTIALSLVSVSANAAGELKRGIFVDHRERCDAGRGYLYYRFDGHHLSYGAPPISENLKRISTSEYTGEHKANNGSLIRDRISIENPDEFVWKSKEGIFLMRYCPKASLPKEWRD